MSNRDPYDVLGRLSAALNGAGVLVDLEVLDTVWGPRIGMKTGIDLDQAHELVFAIEAGTQGRVIRG
ncbi:hypothetical protein [Streptomyces sp. NPDC004042]|uniref:hypothetical protein n=1 Tax=Streptomyces sp. NPDC004042 TaxID=3154451 RepID=UPI0033B4DE5E